MTTAWSRVAIGFGLLALLCAGVFLWSRSNPGRKSSEIETRENSSRKRLLNGPVTLKLADESVVPPSLPSTNTVSMLASLVSAGTNDVAAEERLSLLREWAALNPGDASLWAQKLPAGPVKIESLQHVAIIWAELDAGSALAWARLLPIGEERQTSLLAAGYEIARTDPTNALQIIDILETGPARNQFILYTVSQWAASDPESAMFWVMEVKEGGLRDQLFAEISISWSQKNGDLASRLATRTIWQKEEYRRAVVSVVQRWMLSDPAAAKAWVNQIPDASLQSNCWEVISRNK